MPTQVTFITDLDLKNKALEKARNQGISLKMLLVSAMKAYVEGKIALGIELHHAEPEVEEMEFEDQKLNS